MIALYTYMKFNIKHLFNYLCLLLKHRGRQPLAIVAAAFLVLLQQAPKVVTLKNRPPAALERGPPAGEKLHTDRQARTGARAKCLAGAAARGWRLSPWHKDGWKRVGALKPDAGVRGKHE